MAKGRNPTGRFSERFLDQEFFGPDSIKLTRDFGAMHTDQVTPAMPMYGGMYGASILNNRSRGDGGLPRRWTTEDLEGR